MAKPLLTDELWLRIEPLLPAPKPRPQGGRPPVPDRAALTGILFVLRTGCPWEYLPQEMGCGSGMTCWRRLRDWHAAGIWRQVWLVLLDELGFDAVDAGSLDESWRFERSKPAYCVALDQPGLKAALQAAERTVELPPVNPEHTHA